MSKKKLAIAIVDLLGGKDNISNYVHCVTRLRFNLNDDSKADKNEIEALDGVLGITEQGGQFQVAIGTSVGEVFNEVELLLGNKGEAVVQEEKKKFTLMTVIETLTAIIAPVIPAFTAAGMMKIVLLLLTTLGIANGTEGVYITFNIISDIAFYFLPILIAMNAATRFNVDQGLAVCVGAALLYPSFVSMVAEGTPLTFLGFQIPMYSYSATIFPALLGVLLLSYVYKFWDKIVKNNTAKVFLLPVLSLGITIPLVFLVVAPIANVGAGILANSFTWMIGTIGPFAGLIIGFLMPLMVLTGLHQSLTPIEIVEMSTYGYTMVLPIEFFHNIAEAGAAFGTGVVARDKKFKAIAFQTGATAFMGVSEPALYSVMVKDKFAMLSAMIGNAVGGFLSVLFALKMFSFLWLNIFSMPSFLGGDSVSKTLILLPISIVITFAVSFAMPIVFKVLGLSKDVNIAIMSPVSGKVIPLNAINDKVFSSGLCGKGFGIIPKDGEILAPCDGEIKIAMNHAVGIVAKNGSEILIHAGIDTVKLNGEGIKTLVKQGEKVKRGQLIIEFDKQGIEKKGYDTTCIVVNTTGEIKGGETTGEILVGKKLFSC